MRCENDVFHTAQYKKAQTSTDSQLAAKYFTSLLQEVFQEMKSIIFIIELLALCFVVTTVARKSF